MKEKILEEIKNRITTIKDDRKKKLITSIINNPLWYYKEDFNIVSSILFDLGYKKEEIKRIYITLIAN